MVRWRALCVAVLIISCSGSPAIQQASPSPSRNGRACRLPVMPWTYPGPETKGGFLDLASGDFTVDLQSEMVLDSSTGLNRTPNQPYLYGMYGDPLLAGSSYDPSRHRWLPVPPQYVSPDGSSYAYAVQGQGVHIVDVRSGTDRVVAGTIEPSPNAHFRVAGYLKDSVYLTEWGPTGGPGNGLWRLDPVSQAITQVSTDAAGEGVLVGETPLESPPSVGNPDAWWTGDPGDPHVYFQYLSGAAGQHAETWFQRPGFRMYVIGVDAAGHSIVVAQSTAQVEVWRLGTPNNSAQLYAEPNNGGTDIVFKSAVADPAGWWVGSRTGVFLAADGALTKVSTMPAIVVGGCE